MESGSALSEEFGLLREHLGRLSDHRLRRGLVHPLEGVLSLTALGLMCGCPSLSAHLPLWRYAPPVVDPAGIAAQPVGTDLVPSAGDGVSGGGRQALLEFVIALQARRGDGIATAALDGKTLRGSGKKGSS